MRIELDYGRGKLPVELGNDYDVSVLSKVPMPVLSDPRSAIEATLAAPLAELARKARSVCILICDITRPVPNGLFLPILVRALLYSGLAADNIKILVATGLHQPNTGAELEELVGSRWVLDTVSVHNHNARDDTELVDPET